MTTNVTQIQGMLDAANFLEEEYKNYIPQEKVLIYGAAKRLRDKAEKLLNAAEAELIKEKHELAKQTYKPRDTEYPDLYVIEYRTVGAPHSGTYLAYGPTQSEAVLAVCDVNSDFVIQDKFTVEEGIEHAGYTSNRVQNYLQHKDKVLPTKEEPLILIDFNN